MPIQITSVTDSTYIPDTDNPFQEPLQIGQYVSWPKDNLEEDTDIGTPHSKIRKLATDHYVQTARRSQAQYTHQSAKLHKDYNIGDTVGIKIHQVDRINTDAKLLPCKVYGKDPNESAQYQLYCATGILKTRYQSSDLINMQHVHFPSLEQINPLGLEEISVIQACRDNGRWQAAPGGSICACKGSCISNRCRCKKAGIKCSTKCHGGTPGCCQNRF